MRWGQFECPVCPATIIWACKLYGDGGGGGGGGGTMYLATALLCESQFPTASLVFAFEKQIVCPVLSPEWGFRFQVSSEDSPEGRSAERVHRKDSKQMQSNSKTVSEELWCISAIDPRFKGLPTLSAEQRHDVH